MSARPLEIPQLSLVVLIGVSGSGKSTFARTHFLPTEVVSSDFCRGARVRRRERAVRDRRRVRAPALHRRQAAQARAAHGRRRDERPARGAASRSSRSRASTTCCRWRSCFDLPEELCQERNRDRPDRDFGPHVVRNQHRQLRRGLRGLKREGFRHVFTSRLARGGRRPRRSSGSRSGTTSAPSTARST